MKNVKKYGLIVFVLLIFIGLAITQPDTAIRSSLVMWDYFKEMAFILPPVFILMGLMEVWIPKNQIQKWMGNKSGIKGMIMALVLGTLPTGPLYVAFPMTATLIRKGASYTNMIIFLGSWAALKIPQLMIEVEFLGWQFAVTRFVLTLTSLIMIGMFIEVILKRYPDKEWMAKELNEKQVKSQEIKHTS
jgi:uncharacterized membrane protein YraQ (UPF0718 family)